MRKITIIFSLLIFNVIYAQVSDFNNIDFTRADNIAKLNKGESLQNLSLLSYKLTSKLPTDVEKFRAIYSWVCNNIDGDYIQHDKVLRKRKKLKNDSIALLKWNEDYKKIAFKKLLKYQKTMCTGYAYLIKELSFLANIECEIVNGYGRAVDSNVDTLEMANHSWNAVKINNKWYLCDATWSSGYMDSNSTFVKDYNDGYFLTDPILFERNHYPLQKKWLLNEALINTKFVASPLVYSETFKHKITPISPKKMSVIKTKNEVVNFSFKILKNISNDKISLIQFLGTNKVPFKIYDFKNENGLIEFKYKFKRKGYYDVHLKIEDDIVATYTFEIVRS